MRKLLFLLLFTAQCFGQQPKYTLPLGSWVVIATEMKDGSKVLGQMADENSYTEYRINARQMCVILDAIYRNPSDDFSCMGYSAFGNNTIRTSNFSLYTIDKATADTLVLTEKDDKVTPDKLRRYTMVRREILTQKERLRYEGETSVRASKYFAPTCNLALEDDLRNAFKRQQKEFSVAGKIVFHPKLNTLEAIITKSESKDAQVAGTVKKVINKNYKYWKLEEFASYDAVELPFVLEGKFMHNFSSVRIHFFTNDIDAIRLKQGSSLFDKSLSKVAFDEGLKAITANNYKEAIELFEYAYQLDPLNIDAIYNKAAMLYKSGDTENACLTWKEIADMGQAEAATMWKTYCNK